MEKKENRITPQQIYVSRLRQKMVEKDANVWEMVTVDKTPPPTGNEDMDRVAQVLATSKKITADRIYALFESDPLFGRNLFKAKTGMSISAFVLEYRMLAFCELLACTNMTVREISAYLGCSNEQVTRDFKKWMGCSPIAYRTRNRPKHYDLLFKM